MEINIRAYPQLVALNTKMKTNPSIFEVGFLSNLPVNFSAIYVLYVEGIHQLKNFRIYPLFGNYNFQCKLIY